MSFQFRRLDSTNFHVKLYFVASFYPFKCSISYTMQRRTEENTKERKCGARPVGLLSSRHEAHLYIPRNKDKRETRTNDIRDRNFQPKRSARQVRAFVPRQGYRMHETSETFHLSTRFSCRLPFPIILSSSFSTFCCLSVHDQKYRNYIMIENFSNTVN